MTKIRPLQTAAYAMTRAMDLVSPSRLARELGMDSPSLLYKYADPDEETRQINVDRALEVDRACHDAVGISPFLEIFRANVRGGPTQSGQLKDRVMDVQTGLGQLAAVVRAALDPASHGGSAITAVERDEIMLQVEGLKRVIFDIEKQMIDVGKR